MPPKARVEQCFIHRIVNNHFKSCIFASQKLVNYSVYKITVFGQLQHITLHYPASRFWIAWLRELRVAFMARHLAGVCSKCRAIILHSAHKNICAMIGMDNWRNKHLTPLSLNKCVREVFLGPAKINNHIETSVTFAHSLSFFPEETVLVRLHATTHRRVWQRNCWRTPGCQRCNWGGRVSPSHSGWCCTAGQRTWRRCAPAPWSAWTVLLQGGEKKMSHGSALGFVHSPHTCHIFSPDVLHLFSLHRRGVVSFAFCIDDVNWFQVRTPN